VSPVTRFLQGRAKTKPRVEPGGWAGYPKGSPGPTKARVSLFSPGIRRLGTLGGSD